MISIIICSANPKLLDNIRDNIMNTIGVPHEILGFDNSAIKLGICSVYNKGAAAAKYDLLCFMHEDLNLLTQNWGQIVVEAFYKHKNLGILGVAGSAYKTAAPSGWDVRYLKEELHHFNYIQAYKFSQTEPEHYLSNPSNADLSEVVTVDGMWFCTTKEITSKIIFDEKLLQGFHCYDLDFSFQVGQNYMVAVTFQVLMEHYSEGRYEKSWWNDTLKLHNKWQTKLPLSVVDVNHKNQFILENRAYKRTIELLSEMGYSLHYLLSFFVRQKRKRVISWRLYFKCSYFAIKYFKAKNG